MLEMVVYAERVPKVSKGNMWKDNEVLRFVSLFLSFFLFLFFFSFDILLFQMSSSSSVWLKGDKVMESTLQVNLEITTTEVIERWFINDILVDSFCFSVLYSNLIKKI